MLQNIRFIVLHHTKYREHSAILHGFADRHGRMSLMVHGILGNKAKFSSRLIQSLNLLEAVIYWNEKTDLHQVKELAPRVHFQSLPFDMVKNTQALFLSEILYKLLIGKEESHELFDFISNNIQMLDLSEDNTSVFHLLFLVKLSKYMGIYPGENYSPDRPFFDLKEGRYVDHQPYHPAYLNRDISALLFRAQCLSMNQMDRFRLSREQKRDLLNGLVDYYQLHAHGLQEIKSLPVLRTVFNEP